MFAVPAPTAVTFPNSSTVATPSSLLLHAPTPPPNTKLSAVTVVVPAVVPLIHSELVPAVTELTLAFSFTVIVALPVIVLGQLFVVVTVTFVLS